MPSRHTSSTMSHVPHLSTIINLDPEKEPWCAGYAPSQGRRCHARTNAHGRSSAIELLDKGTESLRAGRHIGDLLGELAPHVLCTRFHQNQASTLTNRWLRQVSPFVKAPQSPPRRTAAQEPSATRRHIPIQTPAERQRSLLIEMERLMSELSSLEQDRHVLARSHDSEVIRDARSMMRTARTMSNDLEATTPSVHASRENDQHRVIHLNPWRHQSINTRIPAAGQSSSTVASTAARLPVAPPSNSGDSSSPQGENHNNNTESPLCSVNPPVRTNSGVTRRPIQGDCGICLTSMENEIWEDTNSEDSDETEDEDSDETDDEDGDGSENVDSDESEDEESEWEYDDDDEEHYSDTEESHGSNSSSSSGETSSLDEEHRSIPSVERDDLVWCKAKCGVNYHKDCIDQWLASDPYKARSCPTCRSTWKS